jgi:hypothetical protein
VPEWPVERICYELEAWNGWGYRRFHPETLSPYLWSGSNKYRAGKYVSDGKWSDTAVSGQSGAMPIIKRLSELDPEVAAAIAARLPEPEPVETLGEEPAERPLDPALEFPKTESVPPLGETTAAGNSPPAPAAVTTTQAHMAANEALKASSWLYNLQRGLSKLLGLGSAGVAGGGLFTSLFEEPVETAMAVWQFVKGNPVKLAVGCVVVLALIELGRFVHREVIMRKEAT